MKPKDESLFCQVRHLWVAATPEEHVRQRLLQWMVAHLGYPKSYLAVEVELQQLAHIQSLRVPSRRADILCFGKKIHPQFPLYPLLLIECKAVDLSAKATKQVLGYNHFVRSYFVAIANQKMIRTGWLDKKKGGYTFVEGLPSYEELLASVQKP